MKQFLIITLILTSALFLSGTVEMSYNQNSGIVNKKEDYTVLSYITHGAISITNNDNFTDYAFPGFGTLEDPYIIEGYSIITTNEIGINIEGTSKHFVIRNCYVNAGRRGINIEDVALGTVTVINNICMDNSFEFGIRLYKGSNAIITNNTCISSRDGINVHTSTGVTLTDNTCISNSYHGIKLEFSNSANLTNNTFSGNGFSGIFSWYSSFLTILNNTCKSNEIGIRLSNSDSGIIAYNLLQENEQYGTFLDLTSDNNVIHHNTFVDNNLEGTSQALDDGTNNKWYDDIKEEGNHWSSWFGGVYLIDGSTGSVDPFPLSEAINPPIISEFRKIYAIPVTLLVCLIFIVLKKRE